MSKVTIEEIKNFLKVNIELQKALQEDCDVSYGIMSGYQMTLDFIEDGNMQYFGCLDGIKEQPKTKQIRHNHITRDIKQPGVCPACDDMLHRKENDT